MAVPATIPPGTSVSGYWQLDAEVTHCNFCGDEFTFLNRRHHCRYCGFIFCQSCCPRRVATDDSRFEGERVCTPDWQRVLTELEEARHATVARDQPRLGGTPAPGGALLASSRGASVAGGGSDANRGHQGHDEFDDDDVEGVDDDDDDDGSGSGNEEGEGGRRGAAARLHRTPSHDRDANVAGGSGGGMDVSRRQLLSLGTMRYGRSGLRATAGRARADSGESASASVLDAASPGSVILGSRSLDATTPALQALVADLLHRMRKQGDALRRMAASHADMSRRYEQLCLEHGHPVEGDHQSTYELIAAIMPHPLAAFMPPQPSPPASEAVTGESGVVPAATPTGHDASGRLVPAVRGVISPLAVSATSGVALGAGDLTTPAHSPATATAMATAVTGTGSGDGSGGTEGRTRHVCTPYIEVVFASQGTGLPRTPGASDSDDEAGGPGATKASGTGGTPVAGGGSGQPVPLLAVCGLEFAPTFGTFQPAAMGSPFPDISPRLGSGGGTASSSRLPADHLASALNPARPAADAAVVHAYSTTVAGLRSLPAAGNSLAQAYNLRCRHRCCRLLRPGLLLTHVDDTPLAGLPWLVVHDKLKQAVLPVKLTFVYHPLAALHQEHAVLQTKYHGVSAQLDATTLAMGATLVRAAQARQDSTHKLRVLAAAYQRKCDEVASLRSQLEQAESEAGDLRLQRGRLVGPGVMGGKGAVAARIMAVAAAYKAMQATAAAGEDPSAVAPGAAAPISPGGASAIIAKPPGRKPAGTIPPLQATPVPDATGSLAGGTGDASLAAPAPPPPTPQTPVPGVAPGSTALLFAPSKSAAAVYEQFVKAQKDAAAAAGTIVSRTVTMAGGTTMSTTVVLDSDPLFPDIQYERRVATQPLLSPGTAGSVVGGARVAVGGTAMAPSLATPTSNTRLAQAVFTLAGATDANAQVLLHYLQRMAKGSDEVDGLLRRMLGEAAYAQVMGESLAKVGGGNGGGGEAPPGAVITPSGVSSRRRSVAARGGRAGGVGGHGNATSGGGGLGAVPDFLTNPLVPATTPAAAPAGSAAVGPTVAAGGKRPGEGAVRGATLHIGFGGIQPYQVLLALMQRDAAIQYVDMILQKASAMSTVMKDVERRWRMEAQRRAEMGDRLDTLERLMAQYERLLAEAGIATTPLLHAPLTLTPVAPAAGGGTSSVVAGDGVSATPAVSPALRPLDMAGTPRLTPLPPSALGGHSHRPSLAVAAGGGGGGGPLTRMARVTTDPGFTLLTPATLWSKYSDLHRQYCVHVGEHEARKTDYDRARNRIRALNEEIRELRSKVEVTTHHYRQASTKAAASQACLDSNKKELEALRAEVASLQQRLKEGGGGAGGAKGGRRALGGLFRRKEGGVGAATAVVPGGATDLLITPSSDRSSPDRQAVDGGVEYDIVGGFTCSITGVNVGGSKVPRPALVEDDAAVEDDLMDAPPDALSMASPMGSGPPSGGKVMKGKDKDGLGASGGATAALGVKGEGGAGGTALPASPAIKVPPPPPKKPTNVAALQRGAGGAGAKAEEGKGGAGVASPKGGKIDASADAANRAALFAGASKSPKPAPAPPATLGSLVTVDEDDTSDLRLDFVLGKLALNRDADRSALCGDCWKRSKEKVALRWSGWARRYVNVLAGYVLYYKRADDRKPQNAFALVDVTSVRPVKPDAAGGKPFALELDLRDGKRYQFGLASKEERNAWFAVVGAVVALGLEAIAAAAPPMIVSPPAKPPADPPAPAPAPTSPVAAGGSGSNSSTPKSGTTTAGATSPRPPPPSAISPKAAGAGIGK